MIQGKDFASIEKAASEYNAEILGIIASEDSTRASVLCDKAGNEFVVWFFNFGSGGFYTGRYFPYNMMASDDRPTAREKALKVFKERII